MTSFTPKLDVIAVVSNPRRYKSRYELYRKFKKHMQESPEVRLWTVETAFGDRPFEVTTGEEREIQLRTEDEVWIKEAMINVAISRLPDDSKYVGWFDADIRFLRDDWAIETIHALQHHKIVQPWSHCIDLGPKSQHMLLHHSFCYEQSLGNKLGGEGHRFQHPGFCWAGRREVLDAMGGFMNFPSLGALDHHAACAMIGQVDYSIHGKVHENYKKIARAWQEKAKKVINGDIGFVEGTIAHFWHGSKKNRKYQERWQILIDNDFDPEVDIVKDANGLWKLAGNKPKLRDDLRKYFSQRNEDGIDME